MADTHGMVSVALLDELLANLPSKVALTPLVDKKPLRDDWQNEPALERDTLADLLLHGEDLPTKKGGTWHCIYTGIGLRLGEVSGGLVAIDHDGQSATQLIEQLAKTSINNALPKTVSVTSGRHGRYQVIYRIPSCYWSAISSRKILTGVKGDDGKPEQLEFRWNGQQSVLAGRHPLTGAYHFRPGMAPWKIEIAECPQWIIEQMLKDVLSDALVLQLYLNG